MGRLCLYRLTLLPGGLLFLLMLADPALPAGSRSPVVLGEARVQLWVRSFVRPAGWGAGGAVCISSKHEVGERMTVLSPGSVRPLSAMLGAGVVKLVTFPCRMWGKWEGCRAFMHRSAGSSHFLASPLLIPIFKLERLRLFDPAPEGRR